MSDNSLIDDTEPIAAWAVADDMNAGRILDQPPPCHSRAYQYTRSVDSQDDKTWKNCYVNEGNRDSARVIGVGLTAGLCGLCVGGPLLGACMGFGSAYAATYDYHGPVGKTARKVGDAVGDATIGIHKKAREIENRHRVVEKVGDAAKEVWEETLTIMSCATEDDIIDPKDSSFRSKRQTPSFSTSPNFSKRSQAVSGTLEFH